MKKAGILTKIIILVLVLALPGFLYYLLVTLGKNHYNALHIFGEKTLSGTSHKVHGKAIPDTIYHTLGDFNLTDQDGKPVSLASFKDKIVVVDFFYSTCPSVCSTMNANMQQLVDAYTKNKLLEFVSITVDPKTDSVAVLKKYAAGFKAIAPKWRFLTGDTATIYHLARKGLLLNALQTTNREFIYSDKLVLLDEEHRIRGYYSGAVPEEATRLDDEIKVLLSQEILNHDSPEY
jgi:protein SCO1/2